MAACAPSSARVIPVRNSLGITAGEQGWSSLEQSATWTPGKCSPVGIASVWAQSCDTCGILAGQKCLSEISNLCWFLGVLVVPFCGVSAVKAECETSAGLSLTGQEQGRE